MYKNKIVELLGFKESVNKIKSKINKEVRDYVSIRKIKNKVVSKYNVTLDQLKKVSDKDTESRINREYASYFWSKKSARRYNCPHTYNKVDIKTYDLNEYFRRTNEHIRSAAKNDYDDITKKNGFRDLSHKLELSNELYGATYRFELAPDETQKQVLFELCRLYREAYNKLSEVVFKYFWENNKILITDRELRDLITSSINKNTNDECELVYRQVRNLLPNTIYSCVCTRVVASYKSIQSNRHNIEGPVTRKEDKFSMDIGGNVCAIKEATLNINPTNKIWKQYNTNGKVAIIPNKYSNLFDLSGRKEKNISYDSGRNKWMVGIFMQSRKCPNISHRISSFDPGIKKFMVLTDNYGKVTDVGTPFKKHVDRIMKYNKSIAGAKTEEHKSILINTLKKYKEKTRRSVDDYHCKLAKYLAINNKALIAPELSRFISLCKGVTRDEYNRTTWLVCRHGNFSYRLRNACNMYSCNYLFSREDYTSKTCGVCGNECKIGADRMINCNKCGNTVDRDVNGAKNIFCRFISFVPNE